MASRPLFKSSYYPHLDKSTTPPPTAPSTTPATPASRLIVLTSSTQHTEVARAASSLVETNITASIKGKLAFQACGSVGKEILDGVLAQESAFRRDEKRATSHCSCRYSGTLACSGRSATGCARRRVGCRTGDTVFNVQSRGGMNARLFQSSKEGDDCSVNIARKPNQKVCIQAPTKVHAPGQSAPEVRPLPFRHRKA